MNIRRWTLTTCLLLPATTLIGCSNEEAPTVADAGGADSGGTDAGGGLSSATPPSEQDEHDGSDGDSATNNEYDNASEGGGIQAAAGGGRGTGRRGRGGRGAGRGGRGGPSVESLSAGGAAGDGGAGQGGSETFVGMGAPPEFGGGAGEFGSNGFGSAANSRSSNPRDWSNQDILMAVEEKDERVLAAIEAKANVSSGDPEFAALAEQILNNDGSMSMGMEAGMGMGAPAAGMGGSFMGLPFGSGLGGGSGINNARSSMPSMSPPKAGSKPPGGAFFQHNKTTIRKTSGLPLDSIEVMLGESMLGFQSRQLPLPSGLGQQGLGGPSAELGNPAQRGQSEHDDDGDEHAGSRGAPSRGRGQPNGFGQSGGRGQPSDFGNSRSGGSSFNGSQDGSSSPGNLEQEDLVRTLVTGLVQNNTRQGWGLLQRIAAGDVDSHLAPAKTLEIVVEAALPSDSVPAELVQDLVDFTLERALEDNDSAAQQLAARLGQSTVSQYFRFVEASQSAPPAVATGGGNAGQNFGGNGRGRGAPAGFQDGGGGAPQLNASGGGNGRGRGAPAGFQGGGGGAPQLNASGGGNGRGRGAPAGFQGGGAGGFTTSVAPVAQLPLLQISETALPFVAKALWHPSVAASVAEKLKQASDFTSAAPIITLATNLPSGSVRRQLFELLKRNHLTGASTLASAGFAGMAADPATLNVLKALPRVRPPREAPDENSEIAKKLTWVDMTKQSVLALRDRIRQVDGNSELVASGSPRIRLHRGATPELSLEITIPEKALELLGESKPEVTKIYYTRLPVTPRTPGEQKLLMEHYEKQARGFARPYQSEGILWIDGVKKNADGTSQTMDVIISSNGSPNQFGQGGAAPSFTIETIAVVSKDPSVDLDGLASN